MSGAPSVRQALRILGALASEGPSPAGTLIRGLGVPRASAYRILGALRDEGFVSYVAASRRYALGPAAYELGFAYSRQGPLGWIGRERLSDLVDRTGQSGHLAVLYGNDVLYIAEERAAGRPSLITDVGVRLPAHLTASGLAMLALLTPQQLRALIPEGQPLPQREGRGPRRMSELRQALQRTRGDGYAQEDGLVTPGLTSLACAIPGPGGHPAAAITLTFTSHRVDQARRAELVRELQRTAQEISRDLGVGVSSPSRARP